MHRFICMQYITVCVNRLDNTCCGLLSNNITTMHRVDHRFSTRGNSTQWECQGSKVDILKREVNDKNGAMFDSTEK